MGDGDRHLETGEHMASIAVGPFDEQRQGVIVDRGVLDLQAAPDQLRARPAGERFEAEERGPAQQRRVHLEERVLGGGADECEQTALHRRQQRVLLRLVEAVHLVEEQDGALPPLTETIPGTTGDLTDILHRGRDRRELFEGLGGGVGDELCPR